MLSVAQNYASDVAYPETVHKDLACRHLADFLHAVLGDLHRAADIADKDVFFVHSQKLGKLGVLAQMLLFAVYGNEKLGLNQAVQYFQLLLAGMTRNMHVVHALVNHLAAAL